MFPETHELHQTFLFLFFLTTDAHTKSSASTQQLVPNVRQHLIDGWAPGRQPQATLSLPAEMKRLTLPWNKPEDNSSVCTMLLVRSREVSWNTLAKHQMKSLVFWDHLPPTSSAITTSRARPFPRHNSGYVLSLCLRASANACPSLLSAFRRCVPSACNGETTVASMANWLPPNNVKPSAMTSKRRASLLWEGVMSRSRTITFADTLVPPSLQICAMAFSAANPLLPSTPTVLHAARWWPKASTGRPHRQVQTVKGRGIRKRRSKRTRYGSESIFKTRWTGNATRARWSGDNRGQRTWSRWCSWDRLGCVFPSMTHLTRLVFGITCLRPQPFRKCFPWRYADAHLPQTSARLLNDFHVPQTDGHSVDDILSAPKMPLLDHLQTICPTAPMSSVPDLRTATDTQTAQGQGQGSHIVGVGRQLLHLQNTAETLQHIAVVTHRILFCVFWRHG